MRTVRRFKSYEWASLVLNPGQELPDAKQLVDSDADFLWCGWQMWSSGAGPTWLYRLADADMRFLSSGLVDGALDFPIEMGGSTPEQGGGNLIHPIYPYRRIPAGAAISIRLIEYTGTTPQLTWIKIVFHGWKEFRV